MFELHFEHLLGTSEIPPYWRGFIAERKDTTLFLIDATQDGFTLRGAFIADWEDARDFPSVEEAQTAAARHMEPWMKVFRGSAEDGASLILKERFRQISAEGWTADHDDVLHKMGELSEAAGCYAALASAQTRGSDVSEWPVGVFLGHSDSILHWPWEEEWWKPSADPIRNLEKAGALIAAEIDLLLRKRAKEGRAA